MGRMMQVPAVYRRGVYPWDASDFHIGLPAAPIVPPATHTRYDTIIKWFRMAARQAESVTVLGDAFELVFNDMQTIQTEEPYKSTLEEMKALSRVKKTRIIKGNHDLGLDKYRELLAPIEVWGPFEQNGVYYTHGFEFDLNIRCFANFHWWLSQHFPHLFHKLVTTPSHITDRQQYNRFVGLIHAAAKMYAIEHGHRAIIQGHTHSPMVEWSPTLPTVVDCGDFEDSMTYVVEGRYFFIEQMA